MADVTSEFTEPLESNANGPESDGVPEELLAELPEQFRGTEVELPTNSAAVEPSDEDSGEDLEEGFEPEDDEEEEEELEEEEQKVAPKGSRAQERIRKLANERKELQAAMQAQGQQAQQQILYAQQMAQQQAAQLQQQYEAQSSQLRAQLDLLQSKAAKEEEANLSPMEQYKRQILREAEERAKSAFDGELGQIKQHLAQQQQAAQEAQAATQRQARYDHYTGEAARLRNQVLLKGMGEDDVTALGQTTDEMLLAFSAAYGIEPEKAAPHFQRFLNRYVQGHLKRQSRASAPKVRKSQQVPGGAPSGRTSGGSAGMPSMASLRAAGFNTHIDWMAAGEPVVPKV